MVIYTDASKPSLKRTDAIRLYDNDSFIALKKVGTLVARCLAELENIIKIGTRTEEIDAFVLEYAQKNNVIPATLNYRGYKKSCCTSINHVVCHGIPDKKSLQEGDIVNVDITFILNGYHGDSSRMYAVGNIRPAAKRLLDVTYACLLRGIEQVKPGKKTGAIGEAIQTFAESNRCSVVRDFCGHGIGYLFHDSPNILHYGKKNEGVEMRPGMVFTIEPMINLGKKDVKVLSDGWTAVTRDRSLSAQYEHMIGVTHDGCEIFTKI